MKKDIRRHSWNITFFFRMLYFVLLYNSAAFEKVRCENQLFFVKRKRISRTETRSTLPGQSVSQNLVSGGDKENGSDQMVQKNAFLCTAGATSTPPWCRVVIVKPLKRGARRTHNRHPILFPRRGSRGSFMRENWTTRILFFIASKMSSYFLCAQERIKKR